MPRSDVSTAPHARYDFIIVGAGTAGCVLANRLSADRSCRVLLLEAGPVDSGFWIHVPLGYGKSMFNPKVNWCSWSAEVPGLYGRKVYCPRGKCLGGTSSINGMLYARGQAEDFDDWARQGATGWDWAGVLPYFRRMENHFLGDSDLHGAGGPLHVSRIDSPHVLADAFIQSAGHCGIAPTNDYNGARQEGASYFQVTIRNGKRVSAADAYLRPALNRPNLDIRTGALTQRINFSEGRARGVTYSQTRGVQCAVIAEREVIVSAGAVGSPQLLQMSGIGAADHLASLGIPVVSHLASVGAGFHDHLRVRMMYRCNRPVSTNNDINSWFGRMRVGLQYLLMKKGPLATGINQAGAFFRTDPSLSRPNMQFMFGTLSADQQGGAIHPFPGFTIVPCVLRPRSRGFVRVRSADPHEDPEIQPNYFGDARDVDELLQGAKFARRVANTAPLRDLVESEIAPGRACDSEADWIAFLREHGTGMIVGHPVGSCRMGNDDGAVVDERLRVRGVRGLRVADASVMPYITSGNTNAPTFMIGEKASDLILEDWRRRRGMTA